MNYYQLRIHDQNGKFLGLIDQFDRVDVVRKLNTVGVLEIQWSMSHAPAIGVDFIIILEVSLNGAPMQIWGEACYFVQKIQYESSGLLTVTAYDAMTLLSRRIIAYPAGTSFTNKSGPADDIIKQLIRENAGNEVLRPDRRLENLVIEADQSLSPKIETECAWMPLLDAIIDAAEASANKGQLLYFDIVSDYDLNLTFRTYANHRGIDRRGLVLNGNHLNDMELELDWTETASVVYVAGQGEGEARETEVVVDSSLINSIYGWREVFVANQNATANQLTDEGLAMLAPVMVEYSGDFIDQPGMQFGIHFRFGDLVTVEGFGYRFECLVDEIDLTIDNGAESLEITLANR